MASGPIGTHAVSRAIRILPLYGPVGIEGAGFLSILNSHPYLLAPRHWGGKSFEAFPQYKIQIHVCIYIYIKVKIQMKINQITYLNLLQNIAHNWISKLSSSSKFKNHNYEIDFKGRTVKNKHTHTYTHTHNSLYLSLSPSLPPSRSRSLSLSLSLALALALSLSLSLSLHRPLREFSMLLALNIGGETLQLDHVFQKRDLSKINLTNLIFINIGCGPQVFHICGTFSHTGKGELPTHLPTPTTISVGHAKNETLASRGSASKQT